MIIFIAIPLGAALLVFMLKNRLADVITVLVSLSLTIWATLLYLVSFENITLLTNSLVLDGFSQLLLLTANLLALIVIIYSVVYIKQNQSRQLYWGMLLVMITGINGVLLAGDFRHLIIFLELTSLAGYGLVSFNNGRSGAEAALKYFIMGTLATMMIVLAAGLISALTGSTEFAVAATKIATVANPIKMFIVALLISGFGMKAALVPFHSWLPDAHTVAPSPISAMLSGIIVKVLGVYTLSRLLFNVIGINQQISLVLLVLASGSILIGSLLMVAQWDMKRLMAYSTIAQVGYIILGLGLATPLGIMAGLFHLFNHAFMKGLLFLTAGTVEKVTGTRDLRQLGGLRKILPVTSLTSLAGSLAISGLPPFNGFWSKLFLIVACLQAGQIGLALIAVVGALLTMGAFLRIQKEAFFGPERINLAGKKEAPLAMTIPLGILATFCLIIGLTFPYCLKLFIDPAVKVLLR